uniref:AB hydrolase-1 domain-containing protein n=1 Tax=Mucochytrium quahogii TaxID=96639 RepID=A0A7S2WI46_9STRA|mmetsp:Transcript_5818/g.10169  ORF Transcript_5818/g.10169 Transcript_5818/m.10169 type:complete len:384 (+) Transcript_5818:77-1228(+)|eukprot:CAMPEP_0203749868 /NCGR_PEP_ID=MMETSP0098-20131031/4253_1 /ASSEMBLY_ACC=CAM_ASM_000208 /TAXON_ID=96639 /ORGANISM=" , Strain NY0313808BC1" /LENGTH=383 /DNA_ID=CAMNT_0050638985 /DNA_START=50 /DNA_END=1201 /DNA_ORIENTATION=+
MGSVWTRYDSKALDQVHDNILKTVEESAYRSGRAVRFKRDQTELANGKHVIHSIECESMYRKDVNNDSPILLMHGYGAGSLLFANNLAGLAHETGRKVIAVDWLGFGASSRPKFKGKQVDDTVEWFLDTFDEWRATKNLEKFDMIAHSMGGYLGAFYCLGKGKGRVDNLVLASPVGVPHAPAEMKTSSNTLKILRKLWNWGVTPNHLVRGAGPYGHRLVEKAVNARFGDVDEERLGLSGGDLQTRTNVVDYLFHITAAPGSGEHALSKLLAPGAYAKKPLCEELPKLEGVNLLFVYGDRDWMDASAGERLAFSSLQHLPTAEVITVPGSHHVYLDHPEVFDKQVSTFLKKTAAKKTLLESTIEYAATSIRSIKLDIPETMCVA